MLPKSTPFVKIPLTQGKTALVSPEDAERVLTLKWSACRAKNCWYARAYVRGSGAKNRVLVSLHRFIANTPEGLHTDHANGNGLDNRRANLRHATVNQNLANTKRKSSSGFRGVQKHGRKWIAQITNGHGVNRFIGSFQSPEEAAHAYDEAARALHGQFARLNFPNPGERKALVIGQGSERYF